MSGDKIFSGQKFSEDKIFGSKLDFRQFCSPKFCPIRYLPASFLERHDIQISHSKSVFDTGSSTGLILFELFIENPEFG